MPEPLDELRQIRLEKLKKLKERGVSVFPQPKPARQKIGEARDLDLESRVLAAGRLRGLRAHGGSTFADLEDESGKIQLFFSREELSQKYDLLEELDMGDFVSVSGTLFKTQAGELTIKVQNFELLAKSLRPLPSSFYGLKDVEERYRQRYVDLNLNPQVRRVFKIRAQVIKTLRRLLDEAGFLEVETPVLQPLYGGATAKPFTTHHNALDADLYLRISDELYLKRLIVGGLEQVYEVGKDFRNEGMDREHNPEFTMMEFYWAYQTYEGLMEFSEKLLSSVVKEVVGGYEVEFEGQKVNFRPPWPKLTFRGALIKYIGLDIEKAKTEEGVLSFIKQKGIKLDLKGVVGLAPLLDELYKKQVRPKLSGPLLLTDHPYQMRPLAKRKESEPEKAASFQLLVAGRELINAYNELNDPLDQRARWEEEGKLSAQGLAEYQVLDEDYLRALEYGMPPTAGWGLGIDRFVSILTGSHNIKDVILFPTLRPEPSLANQEADPRHSGGPPASIREAFRAGSPESSPPPVITSETKDLFSKEDSSGRIPQNDDVVDSGHGQNGGKSGLPLEPEGNFPTREQVFQLVSSHIKNQNLLRHCLAVEAAMRALAKKFGGNEEAWGALGLIHDADWEETKNDPNRHTVAALEWLVGQGHKEGPVVQGLKSHNKRHTKLSELQSIMEWALECADELTGFIVSVALVRPDKKLDSVTVDSVLKKWKAKDFATAVDRGQIEQCREKLGIELPEFISIVLTAMKAIAPELGL